MKVDNLKSPHIPHFLLYVDMLQSEQPSEIRHILENTASKTEQSMKDPISLTSESIRVIMSYASLSGTSTHL